MKRKSMIFYCALSLPLLFSGVEGYNYYNDYLNKTNMEVVKYEKQDIESRKEVNSKYIVDDLVVREQDKIKKAQEEARKKVEIMVEISAYTNDAICVGEWSKYNGLTASGKITSRGTIAVPRDISFGTKILIPEFSAYSRDKQGLFVGEDRGGYITRTEDGVYRIDLWVPTLEEAYKIGRVRTKAYILRD